MAYQTKTKIARDRWLLRDYKGALKILKTFRKGIDETLHEIFDKGYEAMVHPDFYRQIHGDAWVADMEAAAIKATDQYFAGWE